LLKLLCQILISVFCLLYLLAFRHVFYDFLLFSYDISIRVQYLGSNHYSIVKTYPEYSSRFQVAHQYWQRSFSNNKKFKSTDPLWNYSDPFPYLSIYNSRVNICTNQTFLLMIIPSKATDFSIRSVIRDLYPQNMYCHNQTINRVFLIAIGFVERELLILLKNESYIFKTHSNYCDMMYEIKVKIFVIVYSSQHGFAVACASTHC